MKAQIVLTAITIYLNKEAVQCVRCNFTGRFIKRIIGVNALKAIEAAKQLAKAKTTQKVYSFIATAMYILAALLPFVLGAFFYTNGMNAHDSITAACLLSMLFSTMIMLIGCQFSDSAMDAHKSVTV
jgi:hypothetical protein